MKKTPQAEQICNEVHAFWFINIYLDSFAIKVLNYKILVVRLKQSPYLKTFTKRF